MHETDIGDMRYQRAEWLVMRATWVLIAAVMVAMGLGLFANGPLSHAEDTGPDGSLELAYQRFARRGGSTSLEVRVRPGSAEAGRVVLWLPNSYLGAMQVEQVTPRAESEEPVGEGVAFGFSVPDPRAGLEVTFRLRPDAVGTRRGELRLREQSRLRFRQFVYP